MKKYLILLFTSLFLLTSLLALNTKQQVWGVEEEVSKATSLREIQKNITEEELTYSAFLANHSFVSTHDLTFVMRDIVQEQSLLTTNDAYPHEVIKLENKQSASFQLTVETAGLYSIYIDYFFNKPITSDPEGSLKVNNSYQYYEARQIVFKSDWAPKTTDFSLDRYGNEIVPSSEKKDQWYRFINHQGEITDGSRLHQGTLAVYLNSGVNTIELSLQAGEMLFGDVTLTGKKVIPTYQDYIKAYQSKQVNQSLLTIEPEYILSKNDLSIRLASERDKSAAPNYHTTHKLLNNVAHDAWSKGGQSITWKMEVPEDGLYQLAFKYIQYGLLDLPTTRTIMIDGEVPFQELANYDFYYTKRWVNELVDYYLYLTKGTHTLTMQVSLIHYRYLIEEIDRIMQEMSELSLQIKWLTNGQTDQYRDWKITKHIPELPNELRRWANELDELVEYGNQFSYEKNGSSEFSNLKLASKKLRKLAEDPDQVPNRMNEFTDGDSSVSQYLGNTMLKFYQNPLGLEKIYLGGENVKLPRPRANIFVRIWEGIKRFILSFFTSEYSISDVAEDEIEVWVRRSRQYIEIMQKMVDEAGLKVKFSLMPDENKLVLANASNDLPDVAMGLSNWIPYDLAIRGITVNLRTFKGYEELVRPMTKGAMIPYAYGDGMYGIPETQDFWVLFYRTDLTTELGIPIPKTWDEVVGVLPQLQRLGLNFYEPLSSYTGLKPFVATLPFIYQFGGSLYSEDGMTTTLASEEIINALKFMTNLFTIYNVPQEVTNFYNSFRYGTLPMGIANAGTYLQLLVAAPEIKGNWDITLHPGLKDENGVINHYATTGSQGITIFKSSKKQQQAFDFIKWWMSTKTQEDFIINLQGMYGEEYMWLTANNDAFDSLPISSSHKEVIKKQWEWSMEASRIPAAYMVERAISDAFSKIVFNGANTRIALSNAVIEANREIAKKMEEFGYMKNGVKVKDYIVPTIYNIDDWLTEVGE